MNPGFFRTGLASPDKLAAALVSIADEDPRPRRLVAGADVIALAERKIQQLEHEFDRQLSESRTCDEPGHAVFGTHLDCPTARVPTTPG